MTLPLSHSADAATSHAAEARYVASGKLKGDRARVLALHCRFPGRTCQELFELCVRNGGAGAIMDCDSTQRCLMDNSLGYEARVPAVVQFAALRELIKKRTSDLWAPPLNYLGCKRQVQFVGLQWCESGDKKDAFTRKGATCFWPTSRGILENGDKL